MFVLFAPSIHPVRKTFTKNLTTVPNGYVPCPAPSKVRFQSATIRGSV